MASNKLSLTVLVKVEKILGKGSLISDIQEFCLSVFDLFFSFVYCDLPIFSCIVLRRLCIPNVH